MGIPDTFFKSRSTPPEKSSYKDLFVKFDDAIEKVAVPKSLVLNFGKLGIRPNEWALFCLIEAFRSDGKEVPQQNDLAELLGMTPRNIQTIIADMKAKGLLETKVIRRDNNNKTLYNFRKLKEMALAYDKAVN